MRHMFRGFCRALGFFVHARRGVMLHTPGFQFHENLFEGVGVDDVNDDFFSDNNTLLGQAF